MPGSQGNRICFYAAGCCVTPMVTRLALQPYGLWKHPKINREGAKNAKVREGKTNKNPPRNGLSRGISFANFAPSRLRG